MYQKLARQSGLEISVWNKADEDALLLNRVGKPRTLLWRARDGRGLCNEHLHSAQEETDLTDHAGIVLDYDRCMLLVLNLERLVRIAIDSKLTTTY
jgi:hypothetical protein